MEAFVKGIERYIGASREAQRESSPVRRVADIDAPVLLVHGEEAPRAPISHARDFCRALESAGKACETLYFAGEGHGFESPANRLRAYRRALRFIRRHISGEPVT
jgi:dipeptidyl aminopeptidase/acylaminoacyl peptidase